MFHYNIINLITYMNIFKLNSNFCPQGYLKITVTHYLTSIIIASKHNAIERNQSDRDFLSKEKSLLFQFVADAKLTNVV